MQILNKKCISYFFIKLVVFDGVFNNNIVWSVAVSVILKQQNIAISIKQKYIFFSITALKLPPVTVSKTFYTLFNDKYASRI